MTLPPLGLSVNVTDAAGNVTRWASDAPKARDRPRNLGFGSQQMQGFASFSCDLPRRIDRDYFDLSLYDDVEVVGDDGSTAWEGRVSSTPRSADTSHSIGVQAVGWMAHARDRKFQMPFVDRDVSQWQGTLRIAALLVGGLSLGDFSFSATQGQLVCALPNQAVGPLAIAEVWYAAPRGVKVASVQYKGKATSLPAGWGAGSTNFGAPDGSIAVAATSPILDDTLRSLPFTMRYASLYVYAAGIGGTPASGAAVAYSKLAAYGDHGVPLFTGDPTEPQGVRASDVLKYLFSRYCPLLDPSGIQTTDYVIQHLVFRDPTDPYDAVLDINKYHLWDCSVWEKRKVFYGPTDYTDYDWEVRLDDPGVSVTLQGDSTDDLANGIAVTFTDPLTGITERVTPDEFPELRDESYEHPATRHGIPVWTEYQISEPVLLASALQIGRTALAEYNAPKAPGTITTGPYVRNRAGKWKQAWKVRSGDRIVITSSTSLSDRPRVCHEVSYTHGPSGIGSATVAVDSTMKTLPAIIDRISTALTAAGLT